MISIITSLYYSSKFIHPFYAAFEEVCASINQPFEIIFVNDGSPDNSLEVACDLAKEKNNITVVDLTRNFGQHQAVLTGLRFAKGDYILTLDSDLEEDPTLLKLFYQTITETPDTDVVYGIREKRKDPILQRFLSEIFYLVFIYFSGMKNSKNNLFFRLFSRRYLDELLKLNEKNVFILGLFEQVGFKQISLVVPKTYKGKSSYSFKKRLQMTVNAISGFSAKPLYMISYLGVLIAFSFSIYAAVLIFRRLFLAHIITGWTSLMVSIWISTGLILFCLGVIGIYVAKIFDEVKNRPLTHIKQVYSSNLD